MNSYIKNSKPNIWIYITERAGGTITISAATFEVFNSSDVSIQASATATIVDNTTTSPDIYGLVDTTTSSFIACNTYYVLFTLTIGTEVLKYKAPFKVM